MLRLAFCLTTFALLGGCAARPLPPLTPAHPASPAAAEAPLPAPSTALSSQDGAVPDAPGASAAQGQASGGHAH